MQDINLNKSSVNDILHETQAFFNDQGMSILGSSYVEVISDSKYREALVESLTDGMSADSAAEMSQLLNNAAKQTLTESLGGIAPLSSLSMPVIRKLWPKCSMKEAVKRCVASAPIFTISYTKPYLSRVTETGEERVELPRGAFRSGMNAAISDKIDNQYVVRETALTAGTFTKVFYAAEEENENAVAAVKTPLDAEYELVSAEVALSDAGTATKVVYAINEKIGIKPEIITDLRVATATVYDAAGEAIDIYKLNEDQKTYKYATEKAAVEKVKAQIIVRVDMHKAVAEIAILGTAATVVTKGHLSSEWNESGWDVSFDIARHDVRIGTGTHLNAPITIEYLQDTQALYNIDATAEVTDLMTNFFAQKLDIELVDFLLGCFLNRPAHKEFADYGKGVDHVLEFNVAPDAGFAGGPTLWREELKNVIGHLATNIISETFFTEGSFVIAGHPVDVALISNIDWQYKGGNGNVDGTRVSYDVGVLSGPYTFKVVQSLNFPRGGLLVSFIPSGDKQLTQCYYPYTFTMEKGYRSPNHSLVPNLVMTKRDTKFEFTPSTAYVHIVGNDGRGQFHGGNVWSNKFEA